MNSSFQEFMAHSRYRAPGWAGSAKCERNPPLAGIGPAGDDAIVERLIAALLTEPCLDQCGISRHVGPSLCASRPAAHASWWIKLRVENGVVKLDGNVPSRSHKDAAGKVARKVPGARAVINDICVEPT